MSARLGAVDLASWTAPALVDWAALASDGIRLALVRCADGTMVDKRCREHVERARAAGIPAAVWSFVRPSQPAAAQASILAKTTLALGCEGAPWLDLETDGGLSPPLVRSFLRDMLWEVDDLLDGRRTGIYTGPAFWRSRVAGAGVGADLEDIGARALWIAHYGVKAPTIPAPWTSAAIWQYAGNRTIGGGAVVDFDELLAPLETVLSGRP